MAGTQRHPDWDEQRERLSAYLDDELSAEESRILEAHLPTCPECQAALASLRSVHTLLAAMPQVHTPRSFALPLAEPVTPARPATPARTRPAWYPLTQWAGGLAASVGLALVIGSSLLGGANYSAMAPTHGGGQDTSQLGPKETAPSATGLPTQPSATAAPTRSQDNKGAFSASPTSTVTSVPTTTPTEGTERPPTIGADPRTLAIPLGAGLLVGGAGAIVVGRLAARRR